jgi:lauroyl/myristoyl acyltransferase
MADPLGHLRRSATQLAIRQTIAATAALPINVQRSIAGALVAVAGSIPPLRRKVRDNMRLALGHDVPAQAASLYFQHVGWALSRALPTFHHGILATSVPDEVGFDESVAILDDAVAEGRGLVFVAPHWSGHEIIAAIVGQRHPMVMLARDAPTPERMARKLKWYNALGIEIVLRPSQASTMQDAMAYFRVLKSGKMLAITPDLLAGPEQGVETRIFGRPAWLHGGAFALALAARAPMIRVSGQWQSDSRVLVQFERAPLDYDSPDREAAIRAAVQDWCRWFEARLEVNPENWLFWLDKRWSRFLRATARSQGRE